MFEYGSANNAMCKTVSREYTIICFCFYVNVNTCACTEYLQDTHKHK